MTDAAPRPLDGFTIVECATFLAGPFCCATLAEYGARVIKVEHPQGGDPWRAYGTRTDRDGDSLAFLSEGRNKSSVTLDLKHPDGRALFLRLVAKADAVVENFRPGTLESWGLGPDVLAAANPRLILLRISGYGQDGPYRDRPGFARIAHAVGGLTHLAGMPDGPPVTPGSTSLADYVTGLFGANAVLMAAMERARSGLGQVIDLALYEAIFRLLDELAPAYALHGTVRGREGTGTLNACPHGHYPCRDGGWVALACTSDKMFARLTQAMGRPELAARERFGTAALRLQGRVELDGLVQAWTGSMPRDAVVAACVAAEVPCGPVNTIADIFADPHVTARGLIARVGVPGLDAPVALPGVVARLSRSPGRIDAAGPPLGADTDRILTDVLGLDAAEIAALRSGDVI